MDRRAFLSAAMAASVAASATPTLLGEEQPKDALPDAMTFGHLRGRFVFDGDLPVPKRIPIGRNAEVFKDLMLFDESLLVHPENMGLANVAIALVAPKGEDAPLLTVHRSYEKDAEAEVSLTFHNAQITPRVLPIRATQHLNVTNRDPVANNCRLQSLKNPPFNMLMRPDDSVRAVFRTAEAMPCPVNSSIYPWMQGYVWVRDNPYIAVTGKDGSFEIRNLPLGKWNFRMWHERMGFITRGTVGKQELEWTRGVWEIEVRAAMTDLGEIHLPAELVHRP